MKIFSGGKLLNAASARNCFLVNQFATPGLGSLMAGRFIAGLGQLLLAIIGFGLFVYWFLKTMSIYYSLGTGDDVVDGPSYGRFAVSGVLFFLAAWLWSLWTSILIIQQAKANEAKNPPAARPPIISSPPKI